MRKRTLFNDNWQYAPDDLPLDAPPERFEPVTLPHTNRVFPHNNFDNSEYQFISTYRKQFAQPALGPDERLFLEFDGVMSACTVYLNSQRVGQHLGGFISFSVELTQAIRPGVNELVVHVDSRERSDIPPYGHLVDYLTFGGIYRDVHLLQVHRTHLEHCAVRTADVLTVPQLSCDLRIAQPAPGLALEAALLDQAGNQLAQAHASSAGEHSHLQFENIPEITLWSLDQPTLYTLQVSLLLDGVEIDRIARRFGFREARFEIDGRFTLNGQWVKLFGLNRHQTYPYIGAAAPARLQRQDADLLKYELACNIVRTSHYPQSPYFLDRCDEIGLLVLEEITGWQHIGDESWQAISLAELRAMIERDSHHPSIILWGVRVNESGDNDAFYSQTNTLARALDPTRQTGGVRCFRESHFLEDVYTYNDFSNTIQEPNHLPYLITEFAGHMFPTKVWDQEDRVAAHALLHTKLQNMQLGHPQIAGAIGWCAFDYATHIEFGSGDRICYHGVMDMFRLPKWAAYFYKSQQPPSRQVVLQAATRWTMGDRSGGGISPLIVFSNCDEIEVLFGPINVGKFKPDRETYPHLAHPPFIIHGLEQYSAWGQKQFHDLHLIGYVDGQPAADHWISSSRLPARLELSTDTPELYADGADMTRLVFRITDSYGNPLHFAVKVVTFELHGAADLIGENPFPLIGGQAALFIKARKQAGRVTVHAQAPGLPPASVSLEIVPVSG